MRKYGRDELLEILRDYAATGRRVTAQAVCDSAGMTHGPFVREFGSWKAAVLEALGRQPHWKRVGYWTREMIVEAGRSVVDEGEPISCMEFFRRTGIGPTQVYRFWRSFSELRDELGAVAWKPRGRYSKDAILTSFKKLVAEEGDVSLARFAAVSGIGPTVVRKYWGGAKALREAAGLTRPKRPPCVYDDEFLVDEYFRVWKSLGRRPRKADLDLCSEAGYAAYVRRWHNHKAIERVMHETMAKRRAFLAEMKEIENEFDETGVARPFPEMPKAEVLSARRLVAERVGSRE